MSKTTDEEKNAYTFDYFELIFLYEISHYSILGILF